MTGSLRGIYIVTDRPIMSSSDFVFGASLNTLSYWGKGQAPGDLKRIAIHVTSLWLVLCKCVLQNRAMCKKKTSKHGVTSLCVVNSPVTDEFPAQIASYAENVSI